MNPIIEKTIEEHKERRHNWVVRLIKLGRAKIPKAGYYMFADSETDDWLKQSLNKVYEAGIKDGEKYQKMSDDIDNAKTH